VTTVAAVISPGIIVHIISLSIAVFQVASFQFISKEISMATALNMTMPIKQDDETKKQLAWLKENFASVAQSAIDKALLKSGTVHYARVLVIDDKYIQVITEFDGDKLAYTEFFRTELEDVFKLIFSIVEGAPSWEELNNKNTFFEVSKNFNLRALGNATDGDPSQGYLFCSYGDATVREIQSKIGSTPAPGASGPLVSVPGASTIPDTRDPV
jgi:hypothetical protein